MYKKEPLILVLSLWNIPLGHTESYSFCKSMKHTYTCLPDLSLTYLLISVSVLAWTGDQLPYILEWNQFAL